MTSAHPGEGGRRGYAIEGGRAGMERAARDPERVFYQTRIHQVRGRRPS